MLFELDEVRLSRGGRVVLDGLSARIPGGVSALVGPSGSGKSTVLRLLDRLADPDSGTVRYLGADVRELDPLELRREVGLVPQLPALLEGTVADNVRFAAQLGDRSSDVAQLLRHAGLDGSYADRDASRLSVGEQQRAMIARALALEPDVILLDEPTSALDEAATAAVEGTIRRLAAELSVSIVLVTHDASQARRLAATTIRIDRGRVVEGELTAGIDIGLGQVAAALVLVAIAIAISRWSSARLEADMGIAVLRSFVQLTAIGYVIQLIFDQDGLLLVAALLIVMVGFGTLTARSRARKVPRATVPLLVALTAAGVLTIGLVVALGIFEPEPRYLVPVGGMVIGNAMTASAVALNRLGDDFAREAGRVEATLALGATARQAALPLVRDSLRSGTIALIDSTKTTGLIFFPGTMVGMLLAGAEPIDAVRLQLILLWVLLGSVAISALVSTALAYRNFFTPAQQLRDPPPP